MLKSTPGYCVDWPFFTNEILISFFFFFCISKWNFHFLL
jgi:hypothetical protein